MGRRASRLASTWARPSVTIRASTRGSIGRHRTRSHDGRDRVIVSSMNNQLTKLLRLTSRWPEEAQSELADVVREIEAELGAGAYTATPDELAGIDRGLADASQGRFGPTLPLRSSK